MRQRKRLKIEKWAQGKSLSVVIWAQQFAVSADALVGVLEFSKKKEPIPKTKFPPIKEWLRLYQNHRSVQQTLISAYKNFGGFIEIEAHLIENISLSKKPLARKYTEKERQEILDVIYQTSLKDIKSDIDDHIDEESLPLYMKLFQLPEYIFLLKVLVPCWIFYGTHPSKLLLKARHGNINALEKLLRLDTTVLCDSRVSWQLVKLSHQKGKRKFEKLLEALHDGPKNKVSTKKIKYFLAGLISVWSEMLGHRLSAPEIRKLFNAVAVDFAKDKYLDTDLSPSEETFSTAIKRERRFWLPLLKPDKKI